MRLGISSAWRARGLEDERDGVLVNTVVKDDRRSIADSCLERPVCRGLIFISIHPLQVCHLAPKMTSRDPND